MSKLLVGFITYGESSAKYLPYFLPSLNRQTYSDFKIICVDNTEEELNANREYITKNFPEIEYNHAGGNLGFGKSFNVMIRCAAEDKYEYFLALNPDMILQADAIEKMMITLESDASLGAVSPKIMKWDFVNGEETNLIDSCGIILLPGLRFVDSGHAKPDQTTFSKMEILGPSGAAALYRMSALEKVKEGGQYFDELMFMYKEDCDLAYRMHLAGFKSLCVHNSIIKHDRSASARGEGNIQVALNRRNKSRLIKKWSFLNQQIIFVKYWRLQDWKNKLAIVWYEVKMFGYALLFEQYLLLEVFELRRIWKNINRYPLLSIPKSEIQNLK